MLENGPINNPSLYSFFALFTWEEHCKFWSLLRKFYPDAIDGINLRDPLSGEEERFTLYCSILKKRKIDCDLLSEKIDIYHVLLSKKKALEEQLIDFAEKIKKFDIKKQECKMMPAICADIEPREIPRPSPRRSATAEVYEAHNPLFSL